MNYRHSTTIALTMPPQLQVRTAQLRPPFSRRRATGGQRAGPQVSPISPMLLISHSTPPLTINPPMEPRYRLENRRSNRDKERARAASMKSLLYPKGRIPRNSQQMRRTVGTNPPEDSSPANFPRT